MNSQKHQFHLRNSNTLMWLYNTVSSWASVLRGAFCGGNRQDNSLAVYWRAGEDIYFYRKAWPGLVLRPLLQLYRVCSIEVKGGSTQVCQRTELDLGVTEGGSFGTASTDMKRGGHLRFWWSWEHLYDKRLDVLEEEIGCCWAFCSAWPGEWIQKRLESWSTGMEQCVWEKDQRQGRSSAETEDLQKAGRRKRQGAIINRGTFTFMSFLIGSGAWRKHILMSFLHHSGCYLHVCRGPLSVWAFPL